MCDRLQAVTPYGRSAGSSRVRVFDWIAATGVSASIEAYVGLKDARPGRLARHPLSVAQAELRLRRLPGRGLGRLLLHREASPFSRGRIESDLLTHAQFGVYDFDDALMLDHGVGPLYRRLAPKAAKIESAVSAADRVIAGNDALANWASDRARDVVVIPSCVDPPRYTSKTDYLLHDPPRIGWIGSASTERHLMMVAPALRAVNAKTGATLTVISAAGGDLGELNSIVERAPWSEGLQYRGLRCFDIGIMPLIDEPYSRGKCGYKLLQYFAAGVPSVASSVGANRAILALAGLDAPTTTDEWVDEILRLLSMTAAGRAAVALRQSSVVRQHYSFDRWRTDWLRALQITERKGTET